MQMLSEGSNVLGAGRRVIVVRKGKSGERADIGEGLSRQGAGWDCVKWIRNELVSFEQA